MGLVFINIVMRNAMGTLVRAASRLVSMLDCRCIRIEVV